MVTTADSRLADVERHATECYVGGRYKHDWVRADDVRLLLGKVRRVTAERDRARATAVALEQETAHTAERLRAALALVLDRQERGLPVITVHAVEHALSGQEPTT